MHEKHFGHTLAHGRTLIFVQDSFAAWNVQRLADNAGVTVFDTADMGAMRAYLAYSSYLKHDAILLARVPALTVGIRINADRVVWVAGHTVPHVGALAVTYQQAMARVQGEVPRHIIDEVLLCE